MTRSDRRLARLLTLPLAAVLLVLAGIGDAAAATPAYPVQSLGNRGSDVRALQYLLRAHGEANPVDAIFAASTQAAVAAHQADEGLPVTGVVDAATWRSLTPNLDRGSTGLGVRAVQYLLNQKRAAGLELDNTYGAAMAKAVTAFQRHVHVGTTGRVGPVTWQALLWHFEAPGFGSRTGLCDYSVGNGLANWGTAAAIGQLERAGQLVAEGGHGPVAVGDVGLEHGGDIAGHESHAYGLDVDLRPMRTAENQCRTGVTYRSSAYDRAATRALVKAIRAAAPGHVKLIWFNDPVLVREGLTTRRSGHDNHLHVRYCEPGHPVAAYRCPAAALPAGTAPDGEELTGPPPDPRVALLGLFGQRPDLLGFDLTAAAIRAFIR
jgi:peptidoglycan hydrolase-like protein with peptidoglycan-binding domain